MWAIMPEMAEQLFQIAAKAVVRNETGDILMVRISKWRDNPEHWDLPGGRMDPGEGFLDTLKRELQEELGVTYTGTPKQLMSILTKITIPVDGIPTPLVFIIYEVALPAGAKITLDPSGNELDYQWFAPAEAAKVMEFKFSDDFCDLIYSWGNA